MAPEPIANTKLFSNRLLSLLPPAQLEALRPRLEAVTFHPKDVLIKPNSVVGALHFVEAGVVSMIATLEDGARIEVGLVGREGIIGLPLLLGGATSIVEAMAQVEGHAWRLPAVALRAALAEAPALLPLLLRYVDSFNGQVAQTAACNGRHQIEQRLARWLLMTRDRVDSDSFTMTQEFMSTLLGVRRPGVTLAMGALQRAGLVRHERGTVQVLDLAGLEAAACECYQVVNRQFAWLKANPPSSRRAK